MFDRPLLCNSDPVSPNNVSYTWQLITKLLSALPIPLAIAKYQILAVFFINFFRNIKINLFTWFYDSIIILFGFIFVVCFISNTEKNCPLCSRRLISEVSLSVIIGLILYYDMYFYRTINWTISMELRHANDEDLANTQLIFHIKYTLNFSLYESSSRCRS